MAEINLLKQNTRQQDLWKPLAGYLVKFLLVVIVGLLVYYGWLYLQTKGVSKKIGEAQIEIQQTKSAALSMAGRQELFTRQGQLQELQKLVNGHTYWSQVLPALAKVTLKSVSYLSFAASTIGEMQLSVVAPSLEEVEKFLQVFDSPNFNQNFSDVKISGLSINQSGQNKTVNFQLNLKYNSNLLKSPQLQPVQ